MKKRLDIENWERKEHYKFFTKFEEPFWGVTTEIDCGMAYEYSKANGYSFFLYYLHKALVAANDTEPFRYRISGEEVYIYNSINASPTISRQDGTFGFSYMDYLEDFNKFHRAGQKEIERVRNTSGLDPAVSGENVIHFSALPWLKFTSISHARSFTFPDSCPKITFGKMTDEHGVKTMPVSIHVHHALVDGYNVGQFVEKYQRLMNEKSANNGLNQ
ncbi:MAG: chloramphenicol acetyltransferase [Carboxylicivirga sp.]|jgi:chloramphenicol O-acetyltransferase type A|nr:chloramphenicol acetyltransferase [Carboxylicivirga sp.]